MNKILVIKIELQDGSFVYPIFRKYPDRTSVVVSKSQATRFTDEAVAEICSDYFWENLWDRETMKTRQVEIVKSKK